MERPHSLFDRMKEKREQKGPIEREDEEQWYETVWLWQQVEKWVMCRLEWREDSETDREIGDTRVEMWMKEETSARRD